jgi:predicted homoserine dehydrogenase-like protein
VLIQEIMMSLYDLLCKRAEKGNPIRVGLIGAGRYGAMYLAQTRFIPGVQVVGIAELDLERAKKNLLRCGCTEESIKTARSSGDINDEAKRGRIALTTDYEHLIHADLDVIVEITGTVDAASRHAWEALDAEKHVVIVSTEADALVGVALQRKAEEKGVVYSFGYGDEPAEMCEMIDWARTSGFTVACVGKYIEYTPEKRYVNPDTVWEFKKNYTKEQIASGELNAKLFSSFVDGTKTLTEACCAANASGLVPPRGGMRFPTIEYDDMANMLRPKSEGGVLDHAGTVEVPSNFHPDGTPVSKHLRWGVFISVKAGSDYASSFLTDFRNENRMLVDSSGSYGIMYRPTHILGLELNMSIASVALIGMPTGCPKSFTADMIAVAKKDLKPGDMLDGPGAYTTYGQLVPAEESLNGRYLPTGFSENVKVIRSVAKDSILTYDDVQIDENLFSFRLRKDIEAGKF